MRRKWLTKFSCTYCMIGLIWDKASSLVSYKAIIHLNDIFSSTIISDFSKKYNTASAKRLIIPVNISKKVAHLVSSKYLLKSKTSVTLKCSPFSTDIFFATNITFSQIMQNNYISILC